MRPIRVSLACIAGALVAACAQHAALLPSAPSAPAGMNTESRAALVPPNCKGQKTTKKYAELTVLLSSKGGKLCIPAYGGFGGEVKYPGATPPVKLTLISSTKNYNHQPQLGKGTAIFYLQLGIAGGTSFAAKVQAGGGLTSKTIVPGDAYTAYGQATIFSFKISLGPCYTIATKGPYGGVIGGVGALLKGQSVPSKANGVIEIYAGQQTSKKC